MLLIQLKSDLGIYYYVLFTCEKNLGFTKMFTLCMKTINTKQCYPFSTFYTYLVLLPGNYKFKKAQHILDITSVYNPCKNLKSVTPTSPEGH